MPINKAEPPNKLRVQFNRKVYDEKKHKYPIWVTVPHYYISRLSPSVFQKAYPNMMFAAYPLEDGVHWGFETEGDLGIFQQWRKINERKH